MPDQPTLSVVMPNYNHARFLPEALQAILDQSYRPREIIIIDDGSTDNSIEVIQSFVHKDPIVHLYTNEQNRGLIYSLNRGLELASGKYISFPGADDRVLPGLFEKSLDLLHRYPQAGLCSSLSLVVGENGEDRGLHRSPVISRKACFLPPEDARRALRQHGFWAMANTSIYRRHALLEVGGFVPDLHAFSDGFIQQVIALRHGVCFLPEPLACWRQMETGYARTTHANAERMLEILNHGARLMRSTYHDLFPADYVDRWERRERYSTALSAWNVVRRHQEMFLTDSFGRLRPAPSWPDSLFLAAMRLSARTQARAVKLYFSPRLKDLLESLKGRLRRLSGGGVQAW